LHTQPATSSLQVGYSPMFTTPYNLHNLRPLKGAGALGASSPIGGFSEYFNGTTTLLERVAAIGMNGENHVLDR
jgi:hypothetical protein